MMDHSSSIIHSSSISTLKTGTLFVVATPIGNLEDITFRAVRILKEVDLIAAEDTRHTSKLLSHYNISNRLMSCHEHNEQDRLALFSGKTDPGEKHRPCVRCRDSHHFRPGVSAGEGSVPTGHSGGTRSRALCGDCRFKRGRPSHRCLFVHGISPSEKRAAPAGAGGAEKRDRHPLSFMNPPRRLVELLNELQGVLGDRPAMVAREITKIHEEFLRGKLSRIVETLSTRSFVKGECVVFRRMGGPASSCGTCCRRDGSHASGGPCRQ